jgi:hypothetical protein
MTSNDMTINEWLIGRDGRKLSWSNLRIYPDISLLRNVSVRRAAFEPHYGMRRTWATHSNMTSGYRRPHRPAEDHVIYSNGLVSRGGHAIAWLVEALRHKPKVVGSIPDEVIEILNLPNNYSHTMARRNKGRPARRAENLTAICELIV